MICSTSAIFRILFWKAKRFMLLPLTCFELNPLWLWTVTPRRACWLHLVTIVYLGQCSTVGWCCLSTLHFAHFDFCCLALWFLYNFPFFLIADISLLSSTEFSSTNNHRRIDHIFLFLKQDLMVYLRWVLNFWSVWPTLPNAGCVDICQQL